MTGGGRDEALAAMSSAGPASGVHTTLPYQNSVQDWRRLSASVWRAGIEARFGSSREPSASLPERAGGITAAGLTRTQAVTVRLNNPGSVYYGARTTIMDLGLGKMVQSAQSPAVKAGLNIYNLFNPDTITTQVNTFGPTLGNPQTVILGRFFRVSTQIEW